MSIQELHQLFLESSGVATDTRCIEPNKLFFALKGDNFNGNKYALQAINNGAKYAIIDDNKFAKPEQFIMVNNVLETLQELANFHRNYLGLPILAITGSNGKTTSKELIYAVLSKKFRTVATLGNLNNHIGLPLTLLSMNKSTEFGIVEMGANHPKEIESLCKIAQPDYGYITNFGKAHLEGFGSIEGVIAAKSELYSYLKENNKFLFLNADDPIQQKQLSYKNSFSFGSSTGNIPTQYVINKEYAEVHSNGIVFNSLLPGNYNAINIAAAICVGHYFEVPIKTIKEAIANYTPQNNRSQIFEIGKITLLMDAYNANPTSMKAALESFNEFPTENKIAILGDMFELGASSEKEHQDLATYIENLNFTSVFLVGTNFRKVKVNSSKIQQFEKFQELEDTIRITDFQNTKVLIKGSRGMAMERLLDVFKKKESLRQTQ
jgi:UDP-N-acetylmuramoyl-tripeptide--D-alanyl-D-alanine ligase